LNLSAAQRRRAILRTDAGFGDDDNVNYALADINRGYDKPSRKQILGPETGHNPSDLP
jgi:hypothetical protein